MSLLSELKRRHVIRVAVAYLAVAWLLAQVADVVLGNLGAPAWIIQSILWVLLIGFPIAVLFAWAYALTPAGIRRESDIDAEANNGAPPTGARIRQGIAWSLSVAICALLAAGLGFNVGGIRDRLLTGSASGPINSLAVLPLDNLSGDPQQDYFAAGMTEAVIAELGQIEALDVISRTSILRYQDTEKTIPEIAGELGVDALIEGSVLHADDQVRITLLLIDGRSDTHLFARNFEHELSNILTLQADVARAVAAEIELTLTPETEARLAKTRIVNQEAYDLWLRGNFLLDAESVTDPAASQRALEAFQQAASLDPDYAPAFVGIARAYLQLGGWWSPFPPGAYFQNALEAANRAVEVDPDLADAHFVLARVMYLHLWDWEGAEREFRLGMGLEPTDASNSWGIAGYANFLTAMGRFDEAIEVARRAIEIEPLAFWAHGEAGFAQVMAGRPEESLTTLREATELLSSSAELNFILLIANAEAGNMKKAEELLPPVEIIRQVSSPATIGFMGNYYARLGHQAEARELLAHLLAQTSERYVSEPLIALIHIGLGEHEEAVLALERGCREDHDPLCVWLKEHYMYDDLRSDPRFQALVDSMHFPVA